MQIILAHFERMYFEAEQHRKVGNDYVAHKNYNSAMNCYNMALDYAQRVVNNEQQVSFYVHGWG